MGFVYITGSPDGATIRIGYAIDAAPAVYAGQVFLAGVRTGPDGMDRIAAAYAPLLTGDAPETYAATTELSEYVNWLRQQWFTWTDAADGPDDDLAWDEWAPGPDRRVEVKPPDPGALLQFYDVREGPLRDTPWAGLTLPPPAFNDYYTPPVLVEAARKAMGGIDLDAASNWAANRVHRVPRYYHVGRSAFDNPWHGRVWLNPPYGDNAPWFAEITRWWDAGEITQLCMLSPVWAFNTGLAQPVFDLATAFLVLTPAPKFWGRDRMGREAPPESPVFGSDHPHAIMYLGSRVDQFRDAFHLRGMFMRPERVAQS